MTRPADVPCPACGAVNRRRGAYLARSCWRCRILVGMRGEPTPAPLRLAESDEAGEAPRGQPADAQPEPGRVRDAA